MNTQEPDQHLAQGLDRENVQQAMQDILAIRRSINSFSINKQNQITETSFKANQLLQTITLVLCGAMILIELVDKNLITRTLIEKNVDRDWRILGVASIGIFLALCVANMYFIVKRAAQSANDDLPGYIKRNFNYLQNLSHVSDLGVKFVVIAALIWGQKPEWVAPALYLFTGDYLLQGRFFTLSIRASQIWGMLAFSAAFIAFYLNWPQVIGALLFFAAVNLASLVHLRKLRRIDD